MLVLFTYSKTVTSVASPEQRRYTSAGRVVPVSTPLRFNFPSDTKQCDTSDQSLGLSNSCISRMTRRACCFLSSPDFPLPVQLKYTVTGSRF